jgi:hypothetical protein
MRRSDKPKWSYPMPLKEHKAELLRGYRFFQNPEMPTIGFLRFYTDNSEYFCAVTREILSQLSSDLAKHVDKLQPVQ